MASSISSPLHLPFHLSSHLTVPLLSPFPLLHYLHLSSSSSHFLTSLSLSLPFFSCSLLLSHLSSCLHSFFSSPSSFSFLISSQSSPLHILLLITSTPLLPGHLLHHIFSPASSYLLILSSPLIHSPLAFFSPVRFPLCLNFVPHIYTVFLLLSHLAAPFSLPSFPPQDLNSSPVLLSNSNPFSCSSLHLLSPHLSS